MQGSARCIGPGRNAAFLHTKLPQSIRRQTYHKTLIPQSTPSLPRKVHSTLMQHNLAGARTKKGLDRSRSWVWANHTPFCKVLPHAQRRGLPQSNLTNKEKNPTQTNLPAKPTMAVVSIVQIKFQRFKACEATGAPIYHNPLAKQHKPATARLQKHRHTSFNRAPYAVC